MLLLNALDRKFTFLLLAPTGGMVVVNFGMEVTLVLSSAELASGIPDPLPSPHRQM